MQINLTKKIFFNKYRYYRAKQDKLYPISKLL